MRQQRPQWGRGRGRQPRRSSQVCDILLWGQQQQLVAGWLPARSGMPGSATSRHLLLPLPTPPSLALCSQTPLPPPAAPATPAEEEASAIPHRLKKRRAVNYWGLFVYLFFIGAFGFYIWARAAHTLGLGPMLWCGGGGGQGVLAA